MLSKWICQPFLIKYLLCSNVLVWNLSTFFRWSQNWQVWMRRTWCSPPETNSSNFFRRFWLPQTWMLRRRWWQESLAHVRRYLESSSDALHICITLHSHNQITRFKCFFLSNFSAVFKANRYDEFHVWRRWHCLHGVSESRQQRASCK